MNSHPVSVEVGKSARLGISPQGEVSGPAFILASVLAGYPDEGFQESVELLLDDVELRAGLPAAALAALDALEPKARHLLASPAALDDLRSEYIDAFDRGRQVNSLYETEYGRERAMVKGTQLVDVAGFYKAFGFEMGGDGARPEMLDHVAVELEFYALLILKSLVLAERNEGEGVEITRDARGKFLRDHLGRFIGALSERPGIAASPFYSAVFAYCRDLVLGECARLGVDVQPETWMGGRSDPDAEVSCGGSAGCLKEGAAKSASGGETKVT